MPAFRVEVNSLMEAKLLLNVLGDYDSFQYKNRVKGDYCNAGGLEVYDLDLQDWFEWTDPETGENIDSFSLAELRTRQSFDIPLSNQLN